MKFKQYPMLTISSRIILLVLFVGGVLFSCSDDEPALTESFLKIYDDSNLDINYKPIDVVETVDGFIILSGVELSKSDFMGVRLMKMDEEGLFVFDNILSDYVVPIGEMHLNEADSNSYFFAMNPTSLEAVLIGVNPRLEIQTEALIGGINYPLSSARLSNGNLLLQSYDPLSQETEISEISLDGSFVAGTSYSIGPGDDVEVEIINHFLNATDRPLPFFCGEIAPGSYYFNGFYNYSFSLVFTDFSDSPLGVVQGQGSNAGIRAALPLGGADFAIAGYQFDANFQLASVPLTTTGLSSSVDLFPGNMAEVKPYSRVQIIPYTLEESFSVFACETKSRQILLNFYNSSGEISGVHRIGYLNPFTFASIKSGKDQSLLILGTTFSAGRFERIFLNKISAEEVRGFLK